MAARAEHLRQARANLAHAERLLQTFPDDPTSVQWAVSAAFYCALHCIEAHLADRAIHCNTHFERQRTIRQPRAGIPREVRTHYDQLKEWSEQARYFLRQFSPAMVRKTILGQYLPRITSFVNM